MRRRSSSDIEADAIAVIAMLWDEEMQMEETAAPHEALAIFLGDSHAPGRTYGAES